MATVGPVPFSLTSESQTYLYSHSLCIVRLKERRAGHEKGKGDKEGRRARKWARSARSAHYTCQLISVAFDTPDFSEHGRPFLVQLKGAGAADRPIL